LAGVALRKVIPPTSPAHPAARREIPVRPGPGVVGQVMEEGQPTVGQAVGLGQEQDFGLQVAAVWVPFLGQGPVPELALLGRSAVGSVPDLVLG